MSNYPTNLTEKQWQVIKNMVGPQERTGKSVSEKSKNVLLILHPFSFFVKGDLGFTPARTPSEEGVPKMRS